MPVLRLDEPPRFGAQHPLERIPQGKEEQQNEDAGKFPGDHGDVVVSLVHQLLATGDGAAVVLLRAADLLIPADDLSTFAD